MHLLRTFKNILIRVPFSDVCTNPLLPLSSHVLKLGTETQSHQYPIFMRRHYCDNRQPDVQPKVKTFYLPNPFVLLKNKWLTFRIQTEIDQGFSLDDFSIGASYAVSQLTHLMATKQYSAIKDLIYGENEAPVDILKDYTESLSDSKLITEMHFTPEQVSVVHPRIVTVTDETEDDHVVTVDVAAVGFKLSDENRSLILQLQVRFRQSYSKRITSGWLIHNILYIRLQEINRA